MSRVLQAAAWLATALAAGCVTIPLPGDAAADASDVASLDALSGCADLTADQFACAGGDLVGTWVADLACIAPANYDPLDGTCPELAVDGDGSTGATLELRADASYTLTLDEQQAAFAFTFPLACYGGDAAPCRGDSFDGDCEVVGARCACEVAQTFPARVENGQWARSGDQLLLAPAGELTYPTSYCLADRDVLRWVRFAPDDASFTWALVLRRTS